MNGVTAGELVIVHGGVHLTMRGDASMAELCQAHFDGRLPDVSTRGGRIEVTYPHFWPAGWLQYALASSRQSADFTLNAQVPWTIAIHGGAAHLNADLRTVRLNGLDLRGGASHVALALSRPSGLARIAVRGGASNLQVRRPAGVLFRLLIAGGSSRLEFDDMRFGAIGGHFDWQSPEYASAPDKYELEIAGGTSRLTIVGE